ncbi:hypothetical protein [Pseudooceanicola algae]|uniref:Uncharacterized protein n=1 Tax=Pseudooceanicola algae TaxID=1537215 RepID=A0A418SFA2_9RHOB|nr:hypothetical protein [Pseudooceanicola algae]QPM89277.1 hypothetical protein PSAL_004920 [Pseudooceanicola algae]
MSGMPIFDTRAVTRTGLLSGRVRPVAIAALLGLALLPGCEALRRDRGVPAFDGVVFGAKVSSDATNPENFTIAINKPQRTLAGASEAGRYEATKYCIQTFGSSEMTWYQGPDQSRTQPVFADDGDLLLSGACKGW